MSSQLDAAIRKNDDGTEASYVICVMALNLKMWIHIVDPAWTQSLGPHT